jgi:hypothetical protein
VLPDSGNSVLALFSTMSAPILDSPSFCLCQAPNQASLMGASLCFDLFSF